MKLVCQKFGVSPHALTQPVGRRRRQRRRSVRLSAVIAFPGYKRSCCDPDRSRASLLFRRNRPPLANNSVGLLASLCPPFLSPPEHPLGCGRVEREDVGWQLGLAATGGIPPRGGPRLRACRAGFPPAQPGWNLPKHQALQPP